MTQCEESKNTLGGGGFFVLFSENCFFTREHDHKCYMVALGTTHSRSGTIVGYGVIVALSC